MVAASGLVMLFTKQFNSAVNCKSERRNSVCVVASPVLKVALVPIVLRQCVLVVFLTCAVVLFLLNPLLECTLVKAYPLLCKS